MWVGKFPPVMQRLINELTKLPTIGEKSASRLAYYLVMGREDDALALSDALREARQRVTLCRICFALAEAEICEVCADTSRDQDCICVVEKPSDLIAIERTSGYNGLYHVLHGLWSPLKGISPEATKIQQLVKRVEQAQSQGSVIKEVVLATSTTVEGDATALYIATTLADFGVSVTRIAQGLPKGGELEYADQGTLSYALRDRRSLN